MDIGCDLYQKAVSHLKVIKETHDTLAQEVELLREEVRRKIEEQSSLQVQVEQSESASSSTNNLRESVQIETTGISKLQQEIKNVKNSNREMEESLQKVIEQLRIEKKKRASLEKEVTIATEQTKQMTEIAQELQQKVSHSAEFERLIQREKTLREQIQQKKVRMKQLLKESAIVLDTNRKEAQESLNIADGLKTLVGDLEARLERRDQRIEELECRLEEFKAQQKEAFNSEDKTAKEVAEKQKQNSAIEEEIKVSAAKIANLQKRIQKKDEETEHIMEIGRAHV